MEFECTPEGFAGRVKQLRELNNPDKFFSFFDGGGTVQGAFDKALDIFERLMLPWAKQPGTSLDIGYGGGGQVRAASLLFEHSIGIDVHNEWEYVIKYIARYEKQTKTLVQGDGHTLKEIGDNEIDFIHSWTTFMHLGTIDIVKGYLKEIHRVLKPGGTAIIYFARLLRSGSTWAEWKEDIENENNFAERHGKIEVNQINILIGLKYFESLVEEAELIPFGRTASHGKKGVGGQHGVAFMKE